MEASPLPAFTDVNGVLYGSNPARIKRRWVWYDLPHWHRVEAKAYSPQISQDMLTKTGPTNANLAPRSAAYCTALPSPAARLGEERLPAS